MSKVDLEKNLKALKELARSKKYEAMLWFKPYAKQSEFFDFGLTKRERLFMAGNQNGKTLAGAMEMAFHLTGLYPDWWKGRRWNRPIQAWAAAESAAFVRDNQQRLLCGLHSVEEAFGTGSIPRGSFVTKPNLGRGVSGAYDSIQVRHASGGISVLTFKTYEAGRESYQGATLDVIWFDEEPPEDIYVEGLTRTTATDGMVYITFTPMKGATKVVTRYRDEKSPNRVVVQMTIYEAEHISPEKRESIMAEWPAYQRKTRALGIPMAGEGAVFEVSEEVIREPAIEYIPEHWYKLWGIDFGIGHPFAAVLILWDKDADVLHVHAAVRLVDEGAGSLPIQHAKAIKQIAGNIPVAWPQDGTAREKGSGKPLSSLYAAENLKMLDKHATFEDGSMSTEAGLMQMRERMSTGRFKVASHLTQWFDEFRMYHYKDGQVVKDKDDLMSATRIAVMAKRFAVQIEILAGERLKKKRRMNNGDNDDGLFTFAW